MSLFSEAWSEEESLVTNRLNEGGISKEVLLDTLQVRLKSHGWKFSTCKTKWVISNNLLHFFYFESWFCGSTRKNAIGYCRLFLKYGCNRYYYDEAVKYLLKTIRFMSGFDTVEPFKPSWTENFIFIFDSWRSLKMNLYKMTCDVIGHDVTDGSIIPNEWARSILVVSFSSMVIGPLRKYSL